METTRLTKIELTAALRQRDGDVCRGCNRTLDFTLTEGKHMPTIDHIYPKERALRDGWSYDEIWDLSNLQILCRQCNAFKGNKVYDENGNLPAPRRKFQYRRDKRANRPVLTECCYSGRLLLPGETCDECGRASLEHTIPAEYVVKPSDCPHSGLWSCWACYLGMVPREPAIVTVLDGSFLDEME